MAETFEKREAFHLQQQQRHQHILTTTQHLLPLFALPSSSGSDTEIAYIPPSTLQYANPLSSGSRGSLMMLDVAMPRSQSQSSPAGAVSEEIMYSPSSALQNSNKSMSGSRSSLLMMDASRQQSQYSPTNVSSEEIVYVPPSTLRYSNKSMSGSRGSLLMMDAGAVSRTPPSMSNSMRRSQSELRIGSVTETFEKREAYHLQLQQQQLQQQKQLQQLQHQQHSELSEFYPTKQRNLPSSTSFHAKKSLQKRPPHQLSSVSTASPTPPSSPPPSPPCPPPLLQQYWSSGSNMDGQSWNMYMAAASAAAASELSGKPSPMSPSVNSSSMMATRKTETETPLAILNEEIHSIGSRSSGEGSGGYDSSLFISTNSESGDSGCSTTTEPSSNIIKGMFLGM